MHKLEIKLKQHTPLIHFQHDQEGATLRASEVKPKLDKYLVKHAFRDSFDECKEFLIGYIPNLDPKNHEKMIKRLRDKWNCGYRALNYKIRVEAYEKEQNISLSTTPKTTYDEKARRPMTKYFTEDFPFLIANMGEKEEVDSLMNLSYYKLVKLIVYTPNDKLYNIIDTFIVYFFALNNFGQRNTKGFGSFSVIAKKRWDKEEEIIGWDAKSYYENGTPMMRFEINRNDIPLAKQKMIFEVIDFYWRCLKSGVNYTKRKAPRDGYGDVNIRNKERYLKSYLWTYLNEKSPNYTWEKRKIKTAFRLEASFPERIYRDNPNTAIFARGIMGCPDKFEYKVPLNQFFQNNKGEFKEKIESHTIQIKSLKEKIENGNVRYDEGIIERIPSPIIFKPIIDEGTVRVYILFDEQLALTLRALPESEKTFKFVNDDGNSLRLQVIPDAIDYKELIRKFHVFVWSNPDYVHSLFGEYDDRKKWNPANISIIKDSSGKIVARKWGSVDIRWKFIPRNFRWENILSPNDNDKTHFVSFSQIVK